EGKEGGGRPLPRGGKGGGGGGAVVQHRLWCRATNIDALRRRGEGQGAPATGGGGRRVTAIRVADSGGGVTHLADSALLFQLCLDGRRLVLRDARLDGLRSAVDEVL